MVAVAFRIRRIRKEAAMKALKWSRRRVIATGLVLLALAIGPGSTAVAFDSELGVVPPDSSVFGMTYGEWSAAWWQYIVAIPAATNPLVDTSGCGPQQSSGPVLFLAGSFVGPVTRTCTLPAGKAIVLPIINVECSTLEPAPFHGDNEAQLRSCAATFGDAIDPKSLAASINGKKVKDLESFRTQSPVYGLTLPADNILGVTPGVGFSVSDGYWLMLSPLSPGTYKIRVEGACKSGSPCDGFTQDVSYELTVTK
jgi:hypothetical protein